MAGDVSERTFKKVPVTLHENDKFIYRRRFNSVVGLIAYNITAEVAVLPVKSASVKSESPLIPSLDNVRIQFSTPTG